MFKKFSIAIVCIAMLLSFIACSKDDAHQNDGATNPTENALTNDTSQPSKPTEEPSKPTEKPSKPTEEPSKPTEKPSKPTEGPSKPTEELSKPTEEPSKPTEEPSKPTEEPSRPTEEPSKPTEEKQSVFKTEDIVRITFYAYYGGGKGSDVPTEHMTEITNWLGSFTIGEKAPDILPPGTNTYYVEIEYSDGMIIKNGLDIKKIDGIAYYLESNKEPECFMEIISKTSLN